jgi:hypothetical protein
VKIIELIEEVFSLHGIDDARQKAEDAADKVCQEMEANREIVYMVRQHHMLNRWMQVDESEYERALRENGFENTMKLYRHTAGTVTKVPKSISVEVK